MDPEYSSGPTSCLLTWTLQYVCSHTDGKQGKDTQLHYYSTLKSFEVYIHIEHDCKYRTCSFHGPVLHLPGETCFLMTNPMYARELLIKLGRLLT